MNRDDSRSRDHRGVTWERRLAHSTRSYIGTAVQRAVEDNITCNTNNHYQDLENKCAHIITFIDRDRIFFLKILLNLQIGTGQ